MVYCVVLRAWGGGGSTWKTASRQGCGRAEERSGRRTTAKSVARATATIDTSRCTMR